MAKEKLEALKEELNLLTVEDVTKLTGWGEQAVREIMRTDKEFPLLKIGKGYQVSFEALKEYVKHRRIKRGE